MLARFSGLWMLGFAFATALAVAANAKTTFRWVDDQGVVHYGDRIPPQYATKERSVLNAQGVEVKHVDAQKTAAQIEEDARKQQELFKRKQHDSFLITTYTSVKDIEALRDERLQQLYGQRMAAEQYIDTLHSRLRGLQARAMVFRPYNDRKGARRMPDDLAEDLVRTLNEMRSQTDALTLKSREEQSLRTNFQADIERYRELHALHEDH
jgi:hypothetical protein